MRQLFSRASPQTSLNCRVNPLHWKVAEIFRGREMQGLAVWLGKPCCLAQARYLVVQPLKNLPVDEPGVLVQ